MKKIKVSSKEVFKTYEELTEDEKIIYQSVVRQGSDETGFFFIMVLVVVVIIMLCSKYSS